MSLIQAFIELFRWDVAVAQIVLSGIAGIVLTALTSRSGKQAAGLGAVGGLLTEVIAGAVLYFWFGIPVKVLFASFVGLFVAGAAVAAGVGVVVAVIGVILAILSAIFGW